MRASLLALAMTLSLAGCKDDGDRVQAAPTTTPSKACSDNSLDRPGVLPRPPQGRLPCDLIPPGLDL